MQNQLTLDTVYCLLTEPLIKQVENALRLGVSKEELWIDVCYAYETAVRLHQDYMDRVQAGH